MDILPWVSMSFENIRYGQNSKLLLILFDNTIMLGIASIVDGALALVTAVLTKQQTIREKEIKTRLTF
jgi:hypothetical protein